MNTRGVAEPVQNGGRRLLFAPFVLDLHRGCLLLEDAEITLRPKTFAVLRFLVENAGRLVSKDDLLAAVWPDVTVTDDALVQSIGELRRALGEYGGRLITTVPRRGYRFEARVNISSTETPVKADSSVGTPLPQLDPAPPDVMPPEPVPHVLAVGATGADSSLAETRQHGRTSWSSAGRDLLQVARTKWQHNPNALRIGVLALTAAAVVLASWALVTTRPSWEAQLPGATSRASDPPTVATTAYRPTIAVLPFANLSDDKSRDYFADGVTQDIINSLGRFSTLTVMSWNAVGRYKDKPSPPEEVARRLSARFLVEGSVRQTGNRVRVAAQLIGADARVIWSGRFEERLADVFAVQDKITTQVVGALAIRVTQFEQQRALAKPTESLEAYDLVLRARPALQRPTRGSNVEARSLLRRALQLDPNYAAAHAALGESFHLAVSLGWAESPLVFLARAEEAAITALRLNDSELNARILLGRLHLFHDRYEQALAEMARAIAINPSDAHGLAGRGNILMWLGQTDAAIEVLELAQRIDPELNSVDRFSLAMSYYLKHRYDAAIDQALLNIQNAESFQSSYPVLASAYAQSGRRDAAARVVATMAQRHPTFDPKVFGSKFRSPKDLAHVRDGLHKAGFDIGEPVPTARDR